MGSLQEPEAPAGMERVADSLVKPGFRVRLVVVVPTLGVTDIGFVPPVAQWGRRLLREAGGADFYMIITEDRVAAPVVKAGLAPTGPSKTDDVAEGGIPHREHVAGH